MSTCKYCGDASGKYELCKNCYYDSEEKLIDKCKCRNYKDSEYDQCLDCYKRLKQDNLESRKKSKSHKRRGN